MWKSDKKAPVGAFLGTLLFISLLVEIILLLLEPYSVEYAKTGVLTFPYALYAAVGVLFSTPAPVIALFVVLRKEEKISVKEFIIRSVRTPKPLKTILITAFFCLCALVFALIYGQPNGSPWYMMPVGFIVMLPFVGFAEETGWRGFLQPQLEKRFSYPAATSLVAVIWFVWHLPIWLQPSSNHYGDSLIGFAINIFVWAFAAAAIYKSTKSVLACAAYHSFINSIGAIFDWNKLFDSYPKETGMTIYFAVVFAASIALVVFECRKEKKTNGGSGISAGISEAGLSAAE
jgi:membrane protease YdiL (CAAX protease family)